jgi:hypothetical protein
MTKPKQLQYTCYLLLVFHFFYTSNLYAFINIESLRNTKKIGFTGSSGTKLSGAKGNTESFENSLFTQNIFQNEKREVIFLLNHSYGEASKKKNTNKGNLHGRYAQNVSNNLSWETFAQLEYNEFKALKLRQLLGLGLRFNAIKSQSHWLYWGVGTFYEIETITTDLDQQNFRGNIYLSYDIVLTQTMEGVLVFYYQPSFKNNNDFRIQMDSGIEIKITNNFKFTAELQYAYDSRPPLSINREDISYINGMNYNY